MTCNKFFGISITIAMWNNDHLFIFLKALSCKYKKFLYVCFLLLGLSLNTQNSLAQTVAEIQNGKCHGDFINPITDICWKCLFPISIGPVKIGSGPAPDTENPSFPICLCGSPIPRIGISVGFWEPVRAVDVTKKPWCFPNLGGISLNPGIDGGHGKHPTGPEDDLAAWQVHYYIYPLIAWLNILADFACMEQSGFDLAYITELDPLWLDDELSAIINPEAMLFGNIIAQAACAADCIAASSGLPLKPLFWCAGCQGGMYPMNGHVQAHIGSIQSTLLMVQRMQYKLSRQLLAWRTFGTDAVCSPELMPVLDKRGYRTQLVNPTSMTTGRFAGNPFGRSSIFYEANKERPITGEDFGYLLWRKRNCCVL